jgi:hypothetical protein
MTFKPIRIFRLSNLVKIACVVAVIQLVRYLGSPEQQLGLLPATSQTKIKLKTSWNFCFATVIHRNHPNSVIGAVTLGHSIVESSGYYDKLSKIRPEMLLLYIEGSLSEIDKCKLQEIGWRLKLVSAIQPFKTTLEKNFKTPDELKNSFTKLHLWNLKKYDSVIYFSTDSLVVNSLVGMFNYVLPSKNGLPPISEFAAVSQSTTDDVKPSFQSSLYILRPSTITYQKMMHLKYSDNDEATLLGEFSNQDGELGFLNRFFLLYRLILPYRFSLNNNMEYNKDPKKGYSTLI